MSTSTTEPSIARSVWLVAEREIGSKLRSKAFVISTAILFIGALAIVIWGGFQAANNSGTPVAVTADAQQYVAQTEGLDVTDVADRAAGARDALRAQHSTRRFELVSAGDAGWLRTEPGVEVLDFDGGYAVFDADSDETAQRVLRRALSQGDVASFAPQHPSLAQIFKEVIQ